MTDPCEIEFRDTRRDDPARFLRDLRELRSHAGLELPELAARAHYPCAAIKAAEAGPGLPGLPVLSAYVRGCGGIVAEWEERWRAVTGSPASPLQTSRATGWSEASAAGARVGAASVTADDDPDRVIAALNRVADGMAAAAPPSTPPSTPPSPAAEIVTTRTSGAADRMTGLAVVAPVAAGQADRPRGLRGSRTAAAALAAAALLLIVTVLAVFA